MLVAVIDVFGLLLLFFLLLFYYYYFCVYMWVPPQISTSQELWKTLLFMQDYFQSTYKFLELSPHALIPMHGRVNLWPKHILCGYLKYERQLFLFFPSHHSILSMGLLHCRELSYYKISCLTL